MEATRYIPSGRSTIAIPSFARPALAARAAASYASNVSKFGEELDVVVSINDTSDKASNAYASAISKACAKVPCNVFLIDLEAQRRFSQRVASVSGVSEAIVEFCLLGDIAGTKRGSNRYGANRNIILAAMHGSKFIYADDDTVADIEGGPLLPGKIEFWGHSSLETEIIGWVSCDDRPPIESRSFASMHNALLGKSLSSLPSDAIIDQEPCIHRTMQPDDGRVVLTCFGSRGDSGFVDNLSILSSLNARTREFALSDRLNGISSTTSRQIRRNVNNYAVGHSSAVLSMCLGVDATVELPFFFPFGRGEDDVFKAFVLNFFPNYYVGHIPYTILHVPGEQRVGIVPAIRVTFQNLLISLISDIAKGLTTAERRPHGVATALLNLAAMCDLDFSGVCAKAITSSLEIRASPLILSLGMEPKGTLHWEQTVRNLIFSIEEKLELFSSEPCQAMKATFVDIQSVKGIITTYANALLAWPQMLVALDKAGPIEARLPSMAR